MRRVRIGPGRFRAARATVSLVRRNRRGRLPSSPIPHGRRSPPRPQPPRRPPPSSKKRSTAERNSRSPSSRASTSGTVILRSRKSLPTGLPRAASSAVRSSRSSRIWNAIPNAVPKSRSAFTANGEPPAPSAPHSAEAANSEAVFLAATSTYAASEVSRSPSARSCSTSPSVMSASVELSTCGIGCGVAGRDVLENPGEQVVAGEHADPVAEVDRGRVDAAARLGAVDHVVVDQRRDVDQLHERRQPQVIFGPAADRLGGEQREARPQPLPAGGQHPPHRLGDQLVVGAERGAEVLLDHRVQVALGALQHQATPT